LENKLKMNKKIVIVPVFCESHLIKLQIDNIFETIDPDILVYNEGMFPHGPEGCTDMSGFNSKYTLNGEGKRGFDFPELQEIIFEAQKKYKDKRIILNEMIYDPSVKSATKHYAAACTNFKALNINIEEGDYLFPYEGDVFHLESTKNDIQNYMAQLQPDQGFKSIWVDFVQNQYYAELCTLKPFFKNQEGRTRKICVRYGTMDYYKSILHSFESQKYPSLFPTDLITYHYCWFRKDKYKQLRYDQLNRPDYYWKFFEAGLQEIDSLKYAKICMRPDKEGTYRYTHAINLPHPNAIKEHQNYIKPHVDIDKIIERGLIAKDDI
jgi:hypothetical protein